jgi:hypothetical protein
MPHNTLLNLRGSIPELILITDRKYHDTEQHQFNQNFKELQYTLF